MKKYQKLFAAILVVTTLISSMIIPASAASEWVLHAATALEEGKNNFEFAGFDDTNHDGYGDIVCVKQRQTGSKRSEVHIISGKDYKTYLLQVATILGEGGNAFKYVAGDVNSDGYVDIVALMVRGTGSRLTEAHVLDGATNYQSYLLQTALPIEQAYDNYTFSLADRSGDGVLDLYCIKQNNTGSKKVELHILDGSQNFQTFIQQTTTAIGQTSNTRFKFVVGHYSDDSIPDLFALKVSDTFSRSTEIHVVSGANPHKFLLQTGTVLEEAKSNFSFLLGDITSDNKLELICLKIANTGSKHTEVHGMTIHGIKEQKIKASTVWPVLGSLYTDQNNWPQYNGSKAYHSGTDISCAKGLPVYSTHAGTVVTAANLGNKSYGKYIVIKCNTSEGVRYFYYAHLNSIDVKRGDFVSAGETIGSVGSTGNSNGYHLHYEVRGSKNSYGSLRNPTQNPYEYLPNK